MNTFEIAMTRSALFALAIAVAGTILSIWITYLVIKNAIRDGINESRLGSRWAQTVARAEARHDDPPMRAER